jgi:hypothetical protein
VAASHKSDPKDGRERSSRGLKFISRIEGRTRFFRATPSETSEAVYPFEAN